MKHFALKFIAFCTLGVFALTTNSFAQMKENKKLEASAYVIDDFAKMKETIPSQLFEMTEGIIIIPKMINAGLILGGKRGKGVAMVKDAQGHWSDPVFITMTGGSVGFQIGFQAVDLVLVFRNRSSLDRISKSSFTLGGDLSVAAGPVGRSTSASTDYKLEAEVYSYSRSKGLFAGISLSGAALEIDALANTSYYKGELPAKTIFSGNTRAKGEEIQQLRTSLANFYHH